VGTTPTGAALIGGIPPEELEEPTDVTPPEISADVSGTLGDNGWFVSEVKVSYTASDADSGIDTDASDLDDDILSADGAGQSVTGTAVDLQGNSTSVTASGIDIDRTEPNLTAPTDEVVQTGDPSGATVTFAPGASDVPPVWRRSSAVPAAAQFSRLV